MWFRFCRLHNEADNRVKIIAYLWKEEKEEEEISVGSCISSRIIRIRSTGIQVYGNGELLWRWNEPSVSGSTANHYRVWCLKTKDSSTWKWQVYLLLQTQRYYYFCVHRQEGGNKKQLQVTGRDGEFLWFTSPHMNKEYNFRCTRRNPDASAELTVAS
jgi:hypothetical protein